MSDANCVEATILYWGPEGSGKSANLRTIHSKLRSDHRGELREVPTRLDPTVTYEILPIELGEMKGVRTQLQIIASPGGDEHAPTRMQLLDDVDGVVLVLDSQPDQVEANLASFDELRQSLAAYGRRLEGLPVVVQYNKHDLADPVALEDLYRKIEIPGAAVFETVATEGNGALRTLTTISKHVMRVLRERSVADPVVEPEPVAIREPVAAPEPIAIPEPVAMPVPELEPEPVASSGHSQTMLMEEAILAEGAESFDGDDIEVAAQEAQTLLDRPWSDLEAEKDKPSALRIGPDLRIVSVGQAEAVETRTVRIPLVLGNDDGETVSFALTVSLDPLLDGEDP